MLKSTIHYRARFFFYIYTRSTPYQCPSSYSKSYDSIGVCFFFFHLSPLLDKITNSNDTITFFLNIKNN